MAWPIIVAWIHYIGIMLLLASLLGEHLLLKQEMAVSAVRAIQTLDTVYGASATIVLVTGIMRMFLEKGAAYYNHHIAFHILFGIFVIAALISIYPTVIFLRWRNDTRAGRGQQLERSQFKKIQMMIRVEMTLMLLAPLFATWMAHGEFSSYPSCACSGRPHPTFSGAWAVRRIISSCKSGATTRPLWPPGSR